MFIVEFEAALMAMAQIAPINNPCLKRTMNMGPKKFVGKVPNCLVHQHTSKKIVSSDFDTFSRVQMSSQMTAAGSEKAYVRQNTAKSKSINRRSEMSPSTDLRQVGVLSDNMETNSYQSAAFKSSSILKINQSSAKRSKVADKLMNNINRQNSDNLTPARGQDGADQTMNSTLNNLGSNYRELATQSIPEVVPQRPRGHQNNKTISLGQRTKSHENSNFDRVRHSHNQFGASGSGVA